MICLDAREEASKKRSKNANTTEFQLFEIQNGASPDSNKNKDQASATISAYHMLKALAEMTGSSLGNGVADVQDLAFPSQSRFASLN